MFVNESKCLFSEIASVSDCRMKYPLEEITSNRKWRILDPEKVLFPGFSEEIPKFSEEKGLILESQKALALHSSF